MPQPESPTTEPIDAELREIIQAAGELVPAFRALVQRCRTERSPSGELAHQVGSVASQFLALRKRLWPRPRADRLAQEVESLLNFHQQVLEQASNLAFRPRTGDWAELANRFGDGVAGPSRRLMELAQRCD